MARSCVASHIHVHMTYSMHTYMPMYLLTGWWQCICEHTYKSMESSFHAYTPHVILDGPNMPIWLCLSLLATHRTPTSWSWNCWVLIWSTYWSILASVQSRQKPVAPSSFLSHLASVIQPSKRLSSHHLAYSMCVRACRCPMTPSSRHLDQSKVRMLVHFFFVS